jgi:hypothetical protein
MPTAEHLLKSFEHWVHATVCWGKHFGWSIDERRMA